MRPVYLDYNATTPLDPRVAAAMEPWGVERYGNPHSPHRWGYEAAAAVAGARERVAGVLGCDAAAVGFTSGATESANWALKGVLTGPGQTRRRIVTLATEHSCVLDTARYLASIGAELTVLPVRPDGLVDLGVLDAAMGDDVALVSAMLVSNEIGVVQPIAEIAARAHAHGALMHCDAAQGFGKVPCRVDELGVDLLGLTAHKIYGPKGVGALYRRPGVALTPLLHGGGQEDGRSGTLAPALCVGLGEAARLADGLPDAAHARALWERMLSGLPGDASINGSTEARWFGNLNVRVPGVDAARLRGIALSWGSACASGSGRPSHVLAALGVGDAEARASLRLGWGRFTSAADIDAALVAIHAARRAVAA